MKVIRVALDTSITKLVAAGLGVYTHKLLYALSKQCDDVQIVPLSIPDFMDKPNNSLFQKLFSAYWQTIYGQIVLPLRAQQLNCDVIHYTTPIPLRREQRVPSIVTIHDTIPFIHPEWVQPLRGIRMRRSLKLSAKHAHHIISDSHATKEDIVFHLRVPGTKITTVYLGPGHFLPYISAAHAAKTVQEVFQLTQGYILCVGSIEPRKNIINIIKAYNKLVTEHEITAQLAIVGGKVWKQNQVNSLISQYNLRDKVCLTGHVSKEHLSALFRCASVFVYPSFYEGFGMPPLEAMACGCPVITSNTSSLPEVVGDAAIMVPPDNILALTLSIRGILDNPALAESLSLRGEQHIKQFTWERCARETVSVYKQVFSL